MAPLRCIDLLALQRRFPEPATTRTSPPTRVSLTIEGGFLEAWAQGYNVGSLIILILIVFCNYRSGIWLHKLILLEVLPTPHRDSATLTLHSLYWHCGMAPSYSWRTQSMGGTCPQRQPCSSYRTLSTMSCPGSRLSHSYHVGVLSSSSSLSSACNLSG